MAGRDIYIYIIHCSPARGRPHTTSFSVVTFLANRYIYPTQCLILPEIEYIKRVNEKSGNFLTTLTTFILGIGLDLQTVAS